MSEFQSYKTITTRIKSLGDKLSTEKLSAEELEELKSLSRELYERVLILDYKAKEAKVFGESEKQPASETPEEAEKEELDTPVEQPVTVEKETSETPDVTEDSSSVGGIEFDFSGGSDEEDTVEKEDTVEEKKAEQQTIEPVVDFYANTEKRVREEVFSNSETQESEQKDSLKEEDTLNKTSQASFYESFEQLHNASLGDRLGASKLETLQGAIGLNDKMQFIAELFGGDSDAFKQAIDTLDQQPSNESARRTLSEIAARHSWDNENPLVEEFARLIERRYVEN
jgi:hypothetical protein